MDYLRCYHYDGIFSNERIVQFETRSPTDQNWCFVNDEDVIPTEEKEGLVRVVWKEEFDGEILVGINDTGDHRISTFRVPANQLVYREK